MRNPIQSSILLGTLSAILCGCGTTYDVTRVTSLSESTNMQGIFYYLPRTEVNVEAVARSSAPAYGKFYNGTDNIVGSTRAFNGTPFTTYKELFDHNVTECSKPSIGDPVRLEDDNLKGSPSPSFSDFVVSSNTEADQQHLYKLDIDPSALASFSHTITVNEKGIITGADSTVSDAVAPFVFELFKSGLSLASAAFGLAGADQVYCDAFNVARTNRQSFNSSLKVMENSRDAFLRKNFSNVSAEIFNALLKEHDTAISKLKEDHKDGLSLFGKETKNNSYVVVWKLKPKAGTYTYNSALGKPTVYDYKVKPGDDDKPKERVIYVPGTAVRALERITAPTELTTLINNIKFDFYVPQTITAKQSLGPNTQNTGYRYRVPIGSRLDIKKNSSIVASTPISVAQFGPIATLPSQFNGSKGVINLTFNPDTGGFIKANVAGDPISSTAVSQYATSFAEYKTTQNTADAAAETAASAAATSVARADIDANLLEIERLKALKELKDLREALGLSTD